MKYILFISLLFFSLVTSAQEIIELCAGETKIVNYYATSTGEGTNTWYVNNIPYNTDELTMTYSNAGTYNIVLRRENGPCYVEQSLQVVVTECPGISYYIPNSFTPDDNEHNQLFGPIMTEGYDVDGFIFSIYNRWGEKIWESNDPNGKWDGTYNGIMCQDGVYTWKLLFNVFGNDGKIKDTGFVTLIR